MGVFRTLILFSLLLFAFGSHAQVYDELSNTLGTELRNYLPSGGGSPNGTPFVQGDVVIQGWGDSQTSTGQRWCGPDTFTYPVRCVYYGVGGLKTWQMVDGLMDEFATPTGLIDPFAKYIVLASGSNDYNGNWNNASALCGAPPDCDTWSVMSDAERDSVYKDKIQEAITAISTDATGCARSMGCYIPVIWQTLPRCDNVGDLDDCEDDTGDPVPHYYNPAPGVVPHFQAMFAEVITENPGILVVKGWDKLFPYFDGPAGLSTTSVLYDIVHLSGSGDGDGGTNLGSQLVAAAVLEAIGPQECSGNCCAPPSEGLVYHVEPSWSVSHKAWDELPTGCSGTTHYSIATPEKPTRILHNCSGTAELIIAGLPSGRDSLHFTTSPGTYKADGANYPVAGHLPERLLPADPNIEFSAYYVRKQGQTNGEDATSNVGLGWGSTVAEQTYFWLGNRSDSYGLGDGTSINHRADLSLWTLTTDRDTQDDLWVIQSATVGTDGVVRMYLDSALVTELCHDTNETINPNSGGEGNNIPANACPVVSTSTGVVITRDTTPRLGFPISRNAATSNPDIEVGAVLIYNVEKSGAKHQAVLDYLDECVLGN